MQPELKNPWRLMVQMCLAKEWNKGFVIGYDLELSAKDIVQDLFI